MLIKSMLLYPLDVVLGKFFKILSVFNALEFLEAFFIQSSALNYWAALTQEIFDFIGWIYLWYCKLRLWFLRLWMFLLKTI